MKKSMKILLGLATLWPFLYMILFFVFIFSAIIFMPNSGSEESGPPLFFVVIFPLHLLTMLWIMALTVFYMVNVFRNDLVDKDKKVLWAVVIFMGNIIAMPIYWYLYIWRESPVAGSPAPSALGSVDTSGWASDPKAPNREQQYVPPPQPPNWRE
jgi:hypothetical protein